MKYTLSFFILVITFSTSQAASIAKEIKACGKAWEKANEKKYEEAYKISSPKTCPLTHEYLHWEILRTEETVAPFEEYRDFIAAHPNWPWMHVLTRKAESSMKESQPAAEVNAWFSKHAPRTGWGIKLYLKSLKATNQTTKLSSQVKHFWHTFDFKPDYERDFLANYGKYLTLDDHKIRLSRLFFEQKAESIERTIILLPQKEQKTYHTRLQFIKNTDSPHESLKHLNEITADIYYEQIRWHRKKDSLKGAHLISSLNYIDTSASHWAKERLYFAREAFNQGKHQLAYDVLKNHSFKSNQDIEDAEWFCGWLCLRFLNKPEQALKHFKTYDKLANQADRITKAKYWLARTHEVLGNKKKATEFYNAALKYKGTYYSILSQNKLSGRVSLSYEQEGPIDKKSWLQFQNNEFVKISRLLKAAGQPNQSLPFLYLLGKRAKSQSEKRLAIELIQQVLKGYTLFAVKDIGLVENRILPWLYPIRQFDDRALKQGIDTKLMLAIMRQESGFHETIVSTAGATGLMQVMPTTAELMAKKYNYKHKKSCLANDPDYNILLGSHYLKDMLDRYNGSFVLAIAAYNAGPRPVGVWIERYGNPGDADVDVVDWIESIPYKETRGYVKSVLANYYIYSALQAKS